MNTTKVFDRLIENISTQKRIHILQGGTSSSKTYSILQFLYALATGSLEPLLISIVAETMPNLKRGAMRDWMNILGDGYDPKNHNKTDNIYEINKCQVEFFSADQPGKVRGPRRDVLFMNEMNNLSFDTHLQLKMRTKQLVIGDFNPVREFWGHELILDKENCTFDISTYKDNQFLDERIIKDIESLRETNPNKWRVYGQGLIGQTEGLVFPDFELVNEMPDIRTTLGLDFGYTNDPTALVEVGFSGGDMYINELVYEHYLTNQDICKKMEALGVGKTTHAVPDLIYADAAEPKSIEEIHREGYLIKPCVKGRDSINIGIDFMKRYKLKITKTSTNIIKELRNYCWAQDKDGKLGQIPEDAFNHAIDAARYAVTNKIKPLGVVKGSTQRYRPRQFVA